MGWKNAIRGIMRGAKKAGREKGIILKGGGVTKFQGTPTSIPVTPEPTYICQNCGMLIESCHGHTIEECHDYRGDPTNPDLRAHRTILPSRNQPKISLLYYHTLQGKVIK